MLDEIYEHLFKRSYMSGVERDSIRIKATAEVFTPTPLVEEILDSMDKGLFQDKHALFLDPACGDGQILASILYRKLENGSTFEQALSTIYGVDLMPDNVKLCQDRLLCGQEQFRHIVEKNIVCADALRYHYRFDGSDPYSTEEEQIFSNLFSMES
jgi:hypothetical protein